MVSTLSSHSAYLTEFNSPLPSMIDAGKSPLAMLAKTCETIGLPETPAAKKNASHEKSKDITPPSNNTETKKELDHLHLNGNTKRKENQKSPRNAVLSPSSTSEDRKKSPVTSTEPSTSTASTTASSTTLAPAFPPSMLASRCYPMMPFAAFPGFAATPFAYAPPPMPSPYPMIPAYANAMPFPSPFMRCPDLLCKGSAGCPTMMASAATRQTCVTPGCTSCTAHATAANDFMLNLQQSLMAAYAHPLNSAMPPTSSAANLAVYQSLMAAASGALNRTGHVCNWVDSPGGICGRSFSSAEELAAHMKSAHSGAAAAASSSASSTTNTSNSENSTKSEAPSPKSTPGHHHYSSMRFHPYKMPPISHHHPTSLPASVISSFAPGFATAAGFPTAAALQAMYSQRLLGTMPHP